MTENGMTQTGAATCRALSAERDDELQPRQQLPGLLPHGLRAKAQVDENGGAAVVLQRAAPDVDRLLNRASIRQLMQRFYTDVCADPVLAPVFAPRLRGRWDAHLDRMTDFWCAAMKIERGFRGNVYTRHMALPGISKAHLGRWLWLWRRDTGALMATPAAAHLQDVAVGIARVMHLGWFEVLPTRAQVQELVAASAPPPAHQRSAGEAKASSACNSAKVLALANSGGAPGG